MHTCHGALGWRSCKRGCVGRPSRLRQVTATTASIDEGQPFAPLAQRAVRQQTPFSRPRYLALSRRNRVLGTVLVKETSSWPAFGWVALGGEQRRKPGNDD